MSKTKFEFLLRARVAGSAAIKKLGNEIQGVQGKLKNLSMRMGTIGKLTAGVSATAFLTKVFGDTAQLESQRKSLEVLTGDLEKTSQIISEMQEFGKFTPFQVKDLIETTKRLSAFGVETDKVVETTKRLSDIAGATGARLNEIALAYGQVQAKGRLQGEELLQMQERGIALQEELKRMYNLTGVEFSKALEGGRISAEAVERALVNLTDKGGKYADGAIAQSDTLNGKLSQLQDALTVFAQNIGKVLEPIFKGILDFLTYITRAINNIFSNQDLMEQARANVRKNSGRFIGKGVTADLVRAEFQRLKAERGKEASDAPSASTLIGDTPDLLNPRSAAGSSRSSVDRAAADAARERERLEQRIRDAKFAQVDAAAKALTKDKAQISALNQRLSAANLEQQILLEADAIKRIQLESDQRRNALYAEHARQMQGGVSIEQSLVAAKLLQVQLTNENIETQQQLAEAIANTKDESKSFDQSFRDGLEQMGNLAENLGNRLSSAVGEFSDAFTDFLITGKQSFQEFAASLLSDLSRVFMRFAMINALKLVMNADGNVFQGGSVVPYAKGGIVRRPTLFPMANGLGLMGEAGPEAVMPLRRHANGRLGVEASGGAGNVVVNVDARGTQVEGDNARSRQLGDAIGIAVREELISQKRPGGLLS